MKYLIVVGDGMADYPLTELGTRLRYKQLTNPTWIL